MPLNFPSSPTNNQIYLDTVTNTKYIWSSIYGTWTYVSSLNVLSNTVSTQVIFNDGGVANGSSNFVYDKTTSSLEVSNLGVNNFSPTSNLHVTGSANIGGAVFSSSNSTIQRGFAVVSFNAGSNVAAYSTWTPSPSNGNYQYITSNGSFTIAAPAVDCAIDVLLTNDISAKTITFSGYTVQTGGTGDVYATTSTFKYLLFLRRINSISTYVIKALQ